MATSLLPTVNARLNAKARKAYYRALAKLDALPESRATDAPYEAYERYLAALEVLRTSARWALWMTDKGLYANHTAEFHADYAFQHYAFLRDLAHPVQLSPRTN